MTAPYQLENFIILATLPYVDLKMNHPAAMTQNSNERSTCHFAAFTTPSISISFSVTSILGNVVRRLIATVAVLSQFFFASPSHSFDIRLTPKEAPSADFPSTARSLYNKHNTSPPILYRSEIGSTVKQCGNTVQILTAKPSVGSNPSVHVVSCTGGRTDATNSLIILADFDIWIRDATQIDEPGRDFVAISLSLGKSIFLVRATESGFEIQPSLSSMQRPPE